MKKATFLGSLAGLGFLLGALSGAIAAETPMESMKEHAMPQSTQFQRIEQSLSNKVLVTAGGLGLIGLELWWFLLSKPKTRQVIATGGVQEVTVVVDGGYEPGQITVQAGQSVRLNFDRKDPSSCLEEIRFPDFRIAQELPLNQVTAIEFTPDKPGKYEFTCGMNMFRGVVEVQPPKQAVTTDLPSTSTTYRSNHTAHSVEYSDASVSSIVATQSSNSIQEATVTVAKGYQPKRVIVEVGRPVRLQFDRQNSSRCYDKLLIPDFAIAVDLKPDSLTTIEFTPKQVGQHEFMCGMNMNRGVIEVRAAQGSPAKTVVTQVLA